MIIPDQIENIGVVGCGLMGLGIAQLCAQFGYNVYIYDKDRAVLAGARNAAENSLSTLLAANWITEHDRATCLEHLHPVEDFESAMGMCQLVFESVNEVLEIKQKVFAGLESVCGPDTLLCSNTSSIMIEKIGRELSLKNRIVGTHFWNPPTIMPCVEVIKSRDTDDEAVETVMDFLSRIGKEPVRVNRDVPGFVGTRLQLALLREALFIVNSGIADPEDVDRVVKSGFGLRLPLIGLFEMMDLTGHDVGLRVQELMFRELSADVSAPEIMKKMVDAGELGAEAGRGFYNWPRDKYRHKVYMRDSGLLALIQLIKNLEGQKTCVV